MMRHVALMGLTLCCASPALAQDLSPTFDAGQLGQGQVLGSMVENHGRLAARRGTSRRATSAQIAGCRKKAQFRNEYGAGDPRVRRLYGLCRGIGM